MQSQVNLKQEQGNFNLSNVTSSINEPDSERVMAFSKKIKPKLNEVFTPIILSS